jgi:23S rRNA (guanosine2251-2'-O)-methyltransferase
MGGSRDRPPYADRGGPPDRPPYADRGRSGERTPYADRGAPGDRRTYGGRGGPGQRRPYGDRPERRGPPGYRGGGPPDRGRSRPYGDQPDRSTERPQRYEDRGRFGDRPDRYPDRRPGPSAGAAERESLVEADAELIAGRRPVEEAFAARRPARRLLVVPQRRQALESLVLHATTVRIPVVEVEGGTLTALTGFDGHQGVGLVAEPRRWSTIDEMLARAMQQGRPPFILVLDSLEDPQNMGTLLRSAEAAGAHGVIWPSRHSAPLTPAAVKASAGAVEHLLLAQVDDLSGALADLHGRGLRIVGADQEAPLGYREADLRGGLAVVVGSESKGFSPAVRRRLDHSVRIPMVGRVDSLNAAVAGSILLFEAASQREAPAQSSEAPAPNRAASEPKAQASSTGADESGAPTRRKTAARTTKVSEARTEKTRKAATKPSKPAASRTAGAKTPAASKPAAPKRGAPKRGAPKRRSAKAGTSPERPAQQTEVPVEELLPGEPTPATRTTRRRAAPPA